jgi:hypothetical protein
MECPILFSKTVITHVSTHSIRPLPVGSFAVSLTTKSVWSVCQEFVCHVTGNNFCVIWEDTEGIRFSDF